MNSTAAVLRQIRTICKEADSCLNCKFDNCICDSPPEHWTDKEIEEMADTLDDFEEEEEKGVQFDICKTCENEGKEPCGRCIYATRPYADNIMILSDLFKKKEKENDN